MCVHVCFVVLKHSELCAEQARLVSQSLAADRRARRQRQLDQIEIPEGDVLISDELLGKGGFGEVYIADYNGRNAAAKVRRSFLSCVSIGD